MQRVGSDQLVVQKGHRLNQGIGGGLFAPIGALLLIVEGHGHRGAIAVARQTQHTKMIAKHLSIHGQGLGKSAGIGGQPVVEHLVEGLWIDSAQKLVEHEVSGDNAKGLRAFLEWEPHFFALFLSETLSETGDLRDLAPPAQQRHGNQAQQESNAEAFVAPLAGIGHLGNGFAKRIELGLGEGENSGGN
jgi:hypothetical protein